LLDPADSLIVGALGIPDGAKNLVIASVSIFEEDEGIHALAVEREPIVALLDLFRVSLELEEEILAAASFPEAVPRVGDIADHEMFLPVDRVVAGGEFGAKVRGRGVIIDSK